MVTPEQLEAAARVLDVPVDGSATDVRRAYRRAVKRHHPDVSGDPDTSRMVHHAYEVLCAAATERQHRTPVRTATPGAPVRVVNAYGWAGAPTATVGRWVDVAA